MIECVSAKKWWEVECREPWPEDIALLWEWIFEESIFATLNEYPVLQQQLLGWAAAQANESKPEITRLMSILWNRRDDLKTSFPLDSEKSRKEFQQWFEINGIKEHRFTPELSQSNKGTLVGKVAKVFSRSKAKQNKEQRSGGVNVIGSFAGQFGVGQHARSVVQSLETCGVATDLINVKLGPHVQVDDNIATRYTTYASFAANLFAVNAMSATDVFRQIGADNLLPKHNILYGYWELERCPQSWKPYLNLFDELWAPTSFIANALRAVTDIPVHHMPVAVAVPATGFLSRQDLGLPRDRFLFLFHFDSFSFAKRKNPEAVLAAFQHAFPRTQDNVGLVIKTKHSPETAKRLRDLAKDDLRLFIIDKDYSRQEILSLENACDAFVSLHRAEGFGMGPAEMMCFGKPVVVTDYSGNVDFTNSDNSCSVRYRLIDVGPEDYVYWEPNQRWADPDIEQAAWYMKKLVEEPAYAHELGARAKAFMEQHYSYAVVGASYRRRLSQLWTHGSNFSN